MMMAAAAELFSCFRWIHLHCFLVLYLHEEQMESCIDDASSAHSDDEHLMAYDGETAFHF